MPINLGNPDEISVLKAAEEVLEIVGSSPKRTSSKIVFKGLPKDDPKVRRPDISKAKKLLNWEPKVKRQEGFSRTFEYFKKKLNVL